MSGIYIPGMAIPKESGAHKIRLFVREDGTASVWGLEEYIPHEPLEVIPVPEHGRLIDADAALRNGWTINRTYSASPTETVYEVRAIDCLPTIIPADKGGEG